jgi:hypothetical protein
MKGTIELHVKNHKVHCEGGVEEKKQINRGGKYSQMLKKMNF